MKRALILFACLISAIPALADKVAAVTFHSKQPADKVYSAALRTISLQGYSVKYTDESHGTIQANKQAWGGYGEYASVLVTVRSEGDNVTVEAIFTRHSGTIRGGTPPQWAQKFGDELRKSIPDLVRD